jgi:hypothetical protein
MKWRGEHGDWHSRGAWSAEPDVLRLVGGQGLVLIAWDLFRRGRRGGSDEIAEELSTGQPADPATFLAVGRCRCWWGLGRVTSLRGGRRV